MSNPVRARLVASSSITDEVGQRVYAHQLDQGSDLPAITTMHVTTEPENTVDGHAGIRRERWQIDVWSRSYLTSETLADTIQAVMEAAGTDFRAIRINRFNGLEDETQLYRVTLEYSLWRN